MNVNRKNDSMKKILVWGLLAVLGIACYDDLGNYDYNDINDMVLEMPRSVSVTIPKKDSVLVEVKAAVTQLDRKDNANLTYLWKKNLSGVTWTECGTDSVCRIWVYPKNSGQSTLRLAVTDILQHKPTTVKCSHQINHRLTEGHDILYRIRYSQPGCRTRYLCTGNGRQVAG